MTVLFDGVAVTVEAAFGDAPLNTSPSWTDITDYVRGLNIQRGRNSEFTTYSAGTASIRLDNRDRRFDPEHTSGPYYGDLVPMVPVRITTTYSSSTYALFYGYAQGWPTAYNTANTDAVAIVNCVDATRLLANMPITQSDYYNAVIADEPLHYWTFQEPTRETQIDVMQGLEGTLQREPDVTFASIQAGAKYVDAPIGADAMPYAIGGGSLVDLTLRGPYPQSKVRAMEMWFEYGPSVGAARMRVQNADRSEYFNLIVRRTTSTKEFLVTLYSDIDSYHIPQYTVTYSPRTGANHVVVSYNQNTGTIEITLNGTTIDTRSLTAGGGTPPILAGDADFIIDYENTSHGAFYEFDLPAARRTAHWTAGDAGNANPRSDSRYFEALTDGGFPSAWTTRETGVQDVAAFRESDSLLGYARQVEEAEQGAFFVTRTGVASLLNRTTMETANIKALFDDAGTDYPFTNVQVDSNTVDAIRNRIYGTFRAPFENVELAATDATSVSAYGEASQLVDLTLFDIESDAQSVLNTQLARTKDPRTRIQRLDVNIRSDVSMVPTVAQLDLADDVTVAFTPTNVGSELWRAVRVQGISHRITPDSWTCGLYLAPGPVSTNGPLFVLDDDTYGELDAGNKLG